MKVRELVVENMMSNMCGKADEETKLSTRIKRKNLMKTVVSSSNDSIIV